MGVATVLASLLVLLLVFGIALALVAFVLVWVGRHRASSHAACGSCGYAVAGLEAMRCPECGADLREVGIVTPARRWPVPPAVLAVLLALAWTFVLPFPALVVTTLLIDSRPRTYVITSSLTLSSPRRGFREVVIEFSAEGPNAIVPAYARAELREAGGAGGPDRIVRFALPEMLTDGDGATVDARYLADWISPPQDATDAEVTTAAAELMKHVRNGVQGSGVRIVSPAIYTTGASSSTSLRQPLPRWVVPSLVAPWVLLWLIGLLLILRQARRLSRGRGESA